MSLRDFSNDDIVALQEIVRAVRSGRLNLGTRHDSERAWDAGEDHQAPETYIAIPQTGTGIPALEEVGTSGPGEGDIPGSEVCDIYRVVGNELRPVGLSKTVYNVSSSIISGSWIPVVRDKFGKWFAVVGGGSIELSHGVILEQCNPSCSTYRVQRVHRYLLTTCEDCGTGSGSGS